MRSKKKGLIIMFALLLVSSIVFAFINNSKIIEIMQEQGTVDNKEASRLVDIITANDYGRSINYSVTVNGTTLNNWLVLYKDSSHVYIILDECLPASAIPSFTGLKITDANSIYGEGNVYFEIPENVYDNNDTMIAAFKDYTDRLFTFLTTTSYWNELAKGVSGATATGGPTVEMIIASYNEQYSKNVSITEFIPNWNLKTYIIHKPVAQGDISRSYFLTNRGSEYRCV